MESRSSVQEPPIDEVKPVEEPQPKVEMREEILKISKNDESIVKDEEIAQIPMDSFKSIRKSNWDEEESYSVAASEIRNNSKQKIDWSLFGANPV